MASAWTVDEVCEWMNTTVGFPQYEANVRSKEIDGAKLLQLTRRELDGLGTSNSCMIFFTQKVSPFPRPNYEAVTCGFFYN
jgi:hypothetical protein